MSSEGSADRQDGSPSSYILRSWMESTLAEPKTGLTDREWEQLAQVVSVCDQEPAMLAQCARNLVDAFIGFRFPKIGDAQRARMSEKIAQTLCSDPTARTRLLELQRLLQQSTA